MLEQAHRQSVQASLGEMASFLQELLSPRLTAYIAGVEDTKTVRRWANGEIENVGFERDQRLRTAYEVAQLLTQYDSPRIVRAWFVGLNPQLGNQAPADVMREGGLREALLAARAFVAGG